jgi:hypothetical protein
MFDVNYVAVIAVALLNMVIGMIWFSPMLFGSMWLKLIGKNKKEMAKMGKDASKAYPMAFFGVLLMSFCLAVFVQYAGAATLGDGALIGLLAWLGFVATTSMNSVLWEGESKELYLFNNAHVMLTLMVSGAILAVWA